MESAAAYSDRRWHERKACRLTADIDDYDNVYSGVIRNICKGGAFMETAGGPGPGREVILTIPFQDNSNYLIIKGKVAWRREQGVGVTFLKSEPAV